MGMTSVPAIERPCVLFYLKMWWGCETQKTNCKHASFLLFYVVISIKCGTRSKWTRTSNEHHSSYGNVTGSVTSYSNRQHLQHAMSEHKESLKSTYALQQNEKQNKTCALPILSHMSHITISFASILFSYFCLSHIFCSRLHTLNAHIPLLTVSVERSWENNRTNLGLSASHSRIAFNVYCVLYVCSKIA